MAMQEKQKPLLTVLQGQALATPPTWLMRQAGRYLPEYRELRAQAGGFLDLVYSPEKAAEVTLQPIKRFDLDAAILFSDILIVPHALGRRLEFVAGEGPKLDPVGTEDRFQEFLPEQFDRTAGPVYETVARVRERLGKEGHDRTALIGFAGAPWTVATYMVEGGASRDFMTTKKWTYQDPEGFGRLIELITDATIHYLGQQIKAGAEAIKIFDSWAGALDEIGFERWVITPTEKICRALKKDFPDIPVIGFPRGAGARYPDYVRKTGVEAVALDSSVPRQWAAENIQALCPVQGNLDPVCLLAGGRALEEETQRICRAFAGAPFIFNLGHGVIKETPPAHVEKLVKTVKEFKL